MEDLFDVRQLAEEVRELLWRQREARRDPSPANVREAERRERDLEDRIDRTLAIPEEDVAAFFDDDDDDY